MRSYPLLLLALVFAIASPTAYSDQDLEVHFIKVGQGDCTLVVFPSGKTLLIDCGSVGGRFNAQRVRNYIKTHLPATNQNIDMLVITHPDRDHYNRLESVLGTYGSPQIEVEKLMFTGELAAHGDAESWIKGFPSAQRIHITDQSYNRYPSKSLPGFQSEGVSILAANTQSSFSHKNTLSIVLMISYGDFDVMLTGDATKATDQKILDIYRNRHDELDVEVWKAAHHGSWATATQSDRWADVIKPEMVVFSCAWRNGHGHPNINLARLFDEHTIEIEDHSARFWDRGGRLSKKQDVKPLRTEAMLSTSVNGNIVITSDGTDWDWEYDRP